MVNMRMVELLVTPETRRKIIKAKGKMTYDQYLNLKLFGVVR